MKCSEYLKKLNNKPFEQLSNEDINELFNDLLKTLPNKGRLYKYRSFEDEQFSKTIDSLENKYLWIADAEGMKDMKDARLNVDYKSDILDLKQFILDNPYVAFATLYRSEPSIKNQLSLEQRKIVDLFIENIKGNEGDVSINNLIDSINRSGLSRVKSQKLANQMINIINDGINKHTEEIVNVFHDALKITDKIRKDTKIFSMSGSYDNNFMWDNYSEGNGFCIEYDFNKALFEQESIKKLLLRCFKVKYYKRLKTYSFSKIITNIILETADKEFYNEQEQLIYEQMFSKQSFYSGENEWRIILYKGNNKLYTDIVSSIIVDEKSKETEHAKALISLAKKNKWSIKFRIFNEYINDYVYKVDD